MALPPGEELDALVLKAVRNRPVVGEALCVPVGPRGMPLDWQIVASAAGPMAPGAELRKVFVGRCECQRDTHEERLLADGRGERVAGHRMDCLRVVPRYSLESVAALQIWSSFEEIEVCKTRAESAESVSVTIYDKPGVHVEGTSLAHALALAAVAMKEARRSKA